MILLQHLLLLIYSSFLFNLSISLSVYLMFSCSTHGVFFIHDIFFITVHCNVILLFYYQSYLFIHDVLLYSASEHIKL